MALTWQHGNYFCTVSIKGPLLTKWRVRYMLPGAGDHWAKSGAAENYKHARSLIDCAIAEAELGRIGA